MSLIPNETPLEISVVPGNYMAVTIALGILLCLEPDLPVFRASLEIRRSSLKKGFFFDTYCFWLELQSNETGKKQKLMRKV